MEKILKSIEVSLSNKNYYVALFTSLSLPDICGKIEYPTYKKSSARYIKWYEKYLQNTYTEKIGSEKKETVFLCGSDIYALRCAYLHEGNDIIISQSARKVLKQIKFVHPDSNRFKPHCTRINNILMLDVDVFCKDIVEAIKKWLRDIAIDEKKEKLLNDLTSIMYFFECDSHK